MQLDPAKYRHHLDGLDLSEDEKLRFMNDLWFVLESFVIRAFNGGGGGSFQGITERGAGVARVHVRLARYAIANFYRRRKEGRGGKDGP